MTLRIMLAIALAVTISASPTTAQERGAKPSPAPPDPPPSAVRRPAPAPSAPVPTVGGTWSSNWGNMHFPSVASGSMVVPYEFRGNSRLVGTYSGRRFTGIWVQERADERCGTARQGSNYWGQVVLNFDRDLTMFEGNWSYCDASPSRRGWSGRRLN